MKKIIIFVICILFSVPAFGGGIYFLNIDEYDPVTGYFYKGVEISEKSGFLKSGSNRTIDIYVYSPEEDKGTYIFNGENMDKIVTFLYETSFSEKSGSIVFNLPDGSRPIKNNTGIKKRDIRDKMLICTYNEETETYTLWISKKRGENLTRIKSISKRIEWHVDVRNSKIRFVSQAGKNIKIESAEW